MKRLFFLCEFLFIYVLFKLIKLRKVLNSIIKNEKLIYLYISIYAKYLMSYFYTHFDNLFHTGGLHNRTEDLQL